MAGMGPARRRRLWHGLLPGSNAARFHAPVVYGRGFLAALDRSLSALAHERSRYQSRGRDGGWLWAGITPGAGARTEAMGRKWRVGYESSHRRRQCRRRGLFAHFSGNVPGRSRFPEEMARGTHSFHGHEPFEPAQPAVAWRADSDGHIGFDNGELRQGGHEDLLHHGW